MYAIPCESSSKILNAFNYPALADNLKVLWTVSLRVLAALLVVFFATGCGFFPVLTLVFRGGLVPRSAAGCGPLKPGVGLSGLRERAAISATMKNGFRP
jgi:hypothetical protein